MEVYVKCRCGRTLRAQPGEAATTIRCWACHSELTVRPRRHLRLPRRLRRRGPRAAARASISPDVPVAIILLAMLVTLALTIPRIGPWIAFGVLAAAATFYVRRLEDASQVEEPDATEDEGGWSRFRRSAIRDLSRIALGVMLTVGMTAPFWMIDGSRDVEYERKPLEGLPFYAAALVTWIALPLAIYLLTTRDAAGRLGPRWALPPLWRKPLRAAGCCWPFR